MPSSTESSSTAPNPATPVPQPTQIGHKLQGLTLSAHHWRPAESNPAASGADTSATPDRGADTGKGAERTWVLVHGLASNARLWDEVASRIAAAGHHVLAVDLRGHGSSSAPQDGYSTGQAAMDLAELARALDLKQIVAVGQSWGAHVVLEWAAQEPATVSAVACIDGGWIRLAEHFATFEECWQQLAPPDFSGLRYDTLEATLRAQYAHWPTASVDGTLNNLLRTESGGVRARLERSHHRSILRSMYQGNVETLYPRLPQPVLLMPAVGSEPAPQEGDRPAAQRRHVLAAQELLSHAEISWYPGGHHDLHAEQPDAVAADLLRFATSAI